MYEHFYNLTAEPFRLSPDHKFCFAHERYAKAKAYMAYAFMRAEGFVLITGQPGTGKTTLVGDLVETLADKQAAVAHLVSTQLAADDLLRMVAYAYDVDASHTSKAVVLQKLTDRFVTLSQEGRRALLIVDEAQALSEQAMEELRLLTNLQRRGEPLLQIFLLGQPELRELIQSPALEQVHQRIVAASHLQALDEEETRLYVEHRLRTVGWCGDPQISTAVYPVIYRFSEGVPRRINLICSRLFLHCAVSQRHRVTLEDARNVVVELQEEQLSTHNMLADELFHAEDAYEGEAPAVSQPESFAKKKEGDDGSPVGEDSPPVKATAASEHMQVCAYPDEVKESATEPGGSPDPAIAVTKIDSRAKSLNVSEQKHDSNELRPEIVNALNESLASSASVSSATSRNGKPKSAFQLDAPDREDGSAIETDVGRRAAPGSVADGHPRAKPTGGRSWIRRLLSNGFL